MYRLGIIDRMHMGPSNKSVMLTSGSQKCLIIWTTIGAMNILPKQNAHTDKEHTIYIVLIVVSSQTIVITKKGWVQTLKPMMDIPIVGENLSNTPIRDIKTNISPRKLKA